MDQSWKEILKEELTQPYMKELSSFLVKERQNKNVFPPQELVFNAFKETPFERVKVVIVGQDPYHGVGQAHGLSFSVPLSVKAPPSLKNIFQEMHQDLGLEIPKHGCLLPWAKQGVLLLNATLTVREKEPQSHFGMGWERFTNVVIKKLVDREGPIVFLLWGKAAQEKCAQFLKDSKHLILTAAHPSPYSAYNGFFGCRHFSKTNEFLTKHGKDPIDWRLA